MNALDAAISFIMSAGFYLERATMNPAQIEQLIQTALPDAQVKVQSDDNTHFAALIVSDTFAGKRTLQRHQVVYAALGSRMGNEIHALSMQTLTIAESQAQGVQQ
jgi:acid stress-induced BolA-like protein IbaG/YrbA